MTGLADYGLGREEIALITRRSVRRVYVIGDTDTGKTTLADAIAKYLTPKFSTAAVDLDAGQASIGLPTTFGWQMLRPRGGHKPDGLFFTGSTSPTGHLGEWLAGAARMAGEASERAAKVVIDTCGLACGEAGRELHHATVEVIRPGLVVAIERRDELSELLAPFLRSGRPRVIRASAPAQVRTRSRATRRSYRCGKLRAYFEHARQLRFSLDEVGILRPRPDPAGRLASLRDESGRDVALAIVQKYDSPKGTVTVLTPARRRARVRAIVLGSMRIARDGRQLARNV